jgi:death-on-curing protein
MRYLSLLEVLVLHQRVLATTGGMGGVRDMGGLESAVAQPQMTFGGAELYPTLAGKAAALAHSLVCNHPFVDGNKRIGHAAMEVFLVMNGYELEASLDDAERTFLALAAGQVSREELRSWIESHMREVV